VTNEELDQARAEEAAKRTKQLGVYNGSLPVYSISAITEAARLAREGWTPPVTVDPDLAEANKLAYAWHVGEIKDVPNLALASIKRGRELERAEAQPGMVWVKHDGSDVCPVKGDTWVWSKGGGSGGGWGVSPDQACDLAWRNVTHYAIITQPEDAA